MTQEPGKITAEPIERGHLLRYHIDGGAEYAFSVVVTPHPENPSTAQLKGGVGSPPARHRELRRLLRQLGYTRAQWERRRGKRTKWTRAFRV